MYRITDAHLKALCRRLNVATGSPLTYCREGGTFRACIGYFHINYAYGGVQLARLCNEAGGITTFGGHGTKRECAARISAMLDALSLESVSTMQERAQ